MDEMPKRKRGVWKRSSCNPSRVSSSTAFVKPKEDEDAVSIWVQCEIESCQKWRQISAEEAEGLGDSAWYCWLNRDTRYNNCSALEQKAKKPKHMKYIYSLLPLGEVVMAKLSGYPPWPGILTRDPTCGEYYDAPLDKENEITHYHVEFFGQPRSRAWLVPARVHPLRSMNETKMVPQFRKIQGRQLIELKKSYEFALKEAQSSLNTTAEERIETCHFKYVEEEDKPNQVAVGLERADPAEKVEVPAKIPARRNTDTPLNSPTIPLLANIHFGVEQGNLLNPDLKEKEFLERLQSFSLERGVSLPKAPVWRGKSINLLRFYKLVQKRGGFEKVCRRRMWDELYNELVESNEIYEGISTPAQVFYQKYLMPFEHHLGSEKTNEFQFVPNDVDKPPPKWPSSKPVCQRRRTSCSSATDEGEQMVPQNSHVTHKQSADSKKDHGTCENVNNTVVNRAFQSCTPLPREASRDEVPSSNPHSPHLSFGGCSFDSDDDESTSSTCEAAERELQQLERLLLSLEPSLYPQTGDALSKSREQQVVKQFPHEEPVGINKTTEEVDLTRTLDEIARIEGAIADLNTLVSLDMEKL